MFTISIANIKKALAVYKETDSYIKLPKYFFKFLRVFNYIEAKKLLLLRGASIDYIIKLEKVDGKDPIVP